MDNTIKDSSLRPGALENLEQLVLAIADAQQRPEDVVGQGVFSGDVVVKEDVAGQGVVVGEGIVGGNPIGDVIVGHGVVVGEDVVGGGDSVVVAEGVVVKSNAIGDDVAKEDVTAENMKKVVEPMVLTDLPPELKDKIVSKLRFADRGRLRRVNREFKTIVDTHKVKYDLISFSITRSDVSYVLQETGKGELRAAFDTDRMTFTSQERNVLINERLMRGTRIREIIGVQLGSILTQQTISTKKLVCTVGYPRRFQLNSFKNNEEEFHESILTDILWPAYEPYKISAEIFETSGPHNYGVFNTLNTLVPGSVKTLMFCSMGWTDEPPFLYDEVCWYPNWKSAKELILIQNRSWAEIDFEFYRGQGEYYIQKIPWKCLLDFEKYIIDTNRINEKCVLDLVQYFQLSAIFESAEVRFLSDAEFRDMDQFFNYQTFREFEAENLSTIVVGRTNRRLTFTTKNNDQA